MYELSLLPYDFDALEPYIDTHTLGLHHEKHERNYLNKLNELLKKNRYDYRYPITELPKHIGEFPKEDQADILFNLGGVLNHDLYFKSMSPKRQKPNSWLEEKINKKFGSYEKMAAELKKQALILKGSGYVFLVLKPDYTLEIITFKDQETPFSYNLLPLIALDMWEHAYYINYQNKKDIYIDNFLEIIDFSWAILLTDRIPSIH